MVEKGLVRNFKNPVKILGGGDLTVALEVTADKVSSSAQKKIEDAGGKVTLIVKKKWLRERKPKSSNKPSSDIVSAVDVVPEDREGDEKKD